jgi:hypothetical protein
MMAETEDWFETASVSGEANSTESENEWVTVARKKGSERSKAVLENRQPLDLFLIWIDATWENRLTSPGKSGTCWRKLVQSVRVTRSGLILMFCVSAEEVCFKTQNDIGVECFCLDFCSRVPIKGVISGVEQEIKAENLTEDIDGVVGAC